MKRLDFHIFMFFCLCLEGWDKKERPRYGGQPENDIEDLLNEEILGFEEWNVRISCFAMFFEVIFVLLKTNMGFNYRHRGSVSIRAIHASCLALDPFPGATFVAEACCVSFVSHRSPGSAAFAYSRQERLCTGRLGKHPEFNLLN